MSNHIAPCGQCCRRDILIWKMIAAFGSIAAAVKYVENTTNPVNANDWAPVIRFDAIKSAIDAELNKLADEIEQGAK